MTIRRRRGSQGGQGNGNRGSRAQPDGADLDAAPAVVVSGDGQSVTVSLQRRVPLTLLGLLVEDRSIVAAAQAQADASLRE